MSIFKQEKKKNNIVYKTKYTPEKLKKLKQEGVTLRLGNQTLKLKQKKELFKKDLSKPKICVFNINDSKIGIKFSIDEIPDKVYVDYKEINRYPGVWINASIFDSIERNKETVVTLDRSIGQAFKVRVTYLKDSTLAFEDRIYEDKTFKFFYDPPEMIIHKRDNIVLKFFNLERFSRNGYIRIFKKENQEEEECIHSQGLSNKPLVYFDNSVNNHDYYEYRAEVYDNLGNTYDILPKRFLYQKTVNVKNIDLKFDSNTGTYRFLKESAVSFRIEKYNLKTEKVDFIDYIEKEGTVMFAIDDSDQSNLIHIEAYNELDSLTGWAEILINRDSNFSITNESISTNSLFQKVIKWNYEGNVDTFVISMKNSQRQKIISTKPHRESIEGYIYCIDENYSKERIYTEYIINAVNEFGTIIDRKRLVTQ
jgi:hypothetical protein